MSHEGLWEGGGRAGGGVGNILKHKLPQSQICYTWGASGCLGRITSTKYNTKGKKSRAGKLGLAQEVTI